MTSDTANTTAATASVVVYAHDSGQRLRWAFDRAAAEASRAKWLEDSDGGCFPRECVGRVKPLPLALVGDDDEYVGDYGAPF